MGYPRLARQELGDRCDDRHNISLTRYIPTLTHASGASRLVKSCTIPTPPAPHWSHHLQSSPLFHAATPKTKPSARTRPHKRCGSLLGPRGGARAMRSPVSCCGTGTPHPLRCEGRKAGWSYCAVEGPGRYSSSAGCWGWDYNRVSDH